MPGRTTIAAPRRSRGRPQDVSGEIKVGDISPDAVKEANCHIEAMAEIDNADTQFTIQQVNESLHAEVASKDPYVSRLIILWR